MRTSFLFVAFLVVATPTQAAEHTRDTLRMVYLTLADQRAVLLDVRERSEWDAGHLQVARSLPLSALSGARAEDVARIAPPGKVIYLHCASGFRCLSAADALRVLGYDVRPLKAGYRDLLRAGFAPASN